MNMANLLTLDILKKLKSYMCVHVHACVSELCLREHAANINSIALLKITQTVCSCGSLKLMAEFSVLFIGNCTTASLPSLIDELITKTFTSNSSFIKAVKY